MFPLLIILMIQIELRENLVGLMKTKGRTPESPESEFKQNKYLRKLYHYEKRMISRKEYVSSKSCYSAWISNKF